MKKIVCVIGALGVLILSSCGNLAPKNPDKFKGCVVIKIDDCSRMNIKLKLTPELSKEYRCDYMWVTFEEWEINSRNLQVGDTIK